MHVHINKQMFNKINNLKIFFEDCYRRVNVREYARINKISPATASKLLGNYTKEGLLKRETFKNYIFYYTNQKSKDFIDLSRIYWRERLKDFIDEIDEKVHNPTIVLFGSLSKAEVKEDSDVDIAIFSGEVEINFEKYEKKIRRNIQVFWFKSIENVKNEHLRKNIINGYILRGKL